MHLIEGSRKQNLLFIYLTLVLTPILLGSFVYYVLREKKPKIFGAYDIFKTALFSCNELKITICQSYFFKYNFPDAAWAFALAAAVELLVEDESKITRGIYLSAVFAIIFALEILQINFIRGTFDILDLIWEVIAACIAVYFVRRIRDDKNNI